MKIKLIENLVRAHYQQNEGEFLESAQRVIQHLKSKDALGAAKLIQETVGTGLAKMGEAMGTCVHCRLPVSNSETDHWKTCDQHPANKQIEAMKNHGNCVRGIECKAFSLSSCKGCKLWELKR